MVTRSQILGGVAGAVVTFIIIQTYLFYKVPPLNSIQHARLKSSAYVMIKTFVSHCDEADVHCIMVDPYILKTLVEETFKDAHSPCRMLCKNHIYTFAIRDIDFEELKLAVLPKMKSAGFELDVKYSERINRDIPTHIHLRAHDNHAIHLVILHKKTKWWWYGSDLETENVAFSQHEGAIDVFDYDFRAHIDGIELYMPHYPKNFVEGYDNSLFIPCNASRAKMFHQLYPKDESKNATEFRAAGARTIKLIKQRLDNFNVPFWLSSGTLLGWFRQCDFIPYSLDVDIGVFIKDHTEDLLHKLKQSKLALEHKFGKVEDSLQYAFDMGEVKLDIFFFYEEKSTGKMWNGGTDYNNGEKFKYLFDKFTLCWTELYDMKVRVPCDTETYIKANYGPQWFKPVKNWDWKASPSNVFPNGDWGDDELDEVIQLWDKKGKRITLEWTREELR